MVTVVMMSCRQRTRARSLTIPQLEAAGLTVNVFLDDCNPPTGNKPIGVRMLEYAIPLGKPILVVEDDIDLAPDFPEALSMALSCGEITYFYIHEEPRRMHKIYGPHHAMSMIEGTPTPLTLTRARTHVGLFGTQCVLLPLAVARALVVGAARSGRSFDGAVQKLVDAPHSFPAWVVTPNVVQHRHDRTGREAEVGGKASLTFNLPRA